jgi:hypothetical protein
MLSLHRSENETYPIAESESVNATGDATVDARVPKHSVNLTWENRPGARPGARVPMFLL